MPMTLADGPSPVLSVLAHTEKIKVNFEVQAGGKAGVAASDIIVRLTDD
jgi:hypothetical protein